MLSMAVTRLFFFKWGKNTYILGEGSESSNLKDAKSWNLTIYLHLFPSSVIITFYDLIFVSSTLPDKREYFEIHVHKINIIRIKSNCINVSGNT